MYMHHILLSAVSVTMIRKTHTAWNALWTATTHSSTTPLSPWEGRFPCTAEHETETALGQRMTAAWMPSSGNYNSLVIKDAELPVRKVTPTFRRFLPLFSERFLKSKNNPALVFFSFTFLPQPCLRDYNSCLLQSVWGKSLLNRCFHGNGGAEGLQGLSKSTWSQADGRMEVWPGGLLPRWAVVVLFHYRPFLLPGTDMINCHQTRVVNHFWGHTSNKTWSSVLAFDDGKEWSMSW